MDNTNIEKISILTVTRKRPQRLLDMLNSFMNNASGSNKIEHIIVVDDDDELTINSLKNFPYQDITKVYILPRTKLLSSLWNKAYEKCEGDIILPSSDDVLMRTKNWDIIIRDIFDKSEDKILIIHPNDGIQNEAMCTIPIMHRKWVEVVGYVLPPYFAADCADNWLHEVSSMLGRRVYTPSIFIEHMHFGWGKSPFDEVYEERRNMRVSEGVGDLYGNMQRERESDVDKLMAYINSKKTI